MLLHWLWLSERPGLNLRDKQALLEQFADPEDLYAAGEAQLRALDWLSAEQREMLLDKDLSAAEWLLAECGKKCVHILTFHDTAYPALLKQIAQPPLVLYYKGSLPDFSQELVIGVVGTRKASAYGVTTAKRMAHRISRCGAVVVTGLAYGIDSAAAAGALSAGGPVMGILGCAIDKIYPASNRELYGWVERQGCLISEYPPGTRTFPSHFLQRNRIISGISQGVLIVEAPEKSGALNTAGWCLEQGRDVFVVPGNIDMESCAGSNALLRQGAIPVTSGWEVVQDYEAAFPGKLHRDETPMAVYPRQDSVPKVAQNAAPVAAKPPITAEKDKKAVDISAFAAYSGVNTASRDLKPAEEALLQVMTEEDEHTDALLARCGMPRTDALAALTTLTMKGFVTALPGRRVKRIK